MPATTTQAITIIKRSTGTTVVAGADFPDHTEREHDILELIAQGYNNQAIAN